MKKNLLALLLLGAAAILFMKYTPAEPSPILGKEFKVHQYTKNALPAGYGLLYITFQKEASDLLTAYIDFNGDGSFEDSEKVADRIPLRTRENWMSGIPIRLTDMLKEGVRIKVSLSHSGENREGNLSISAEEKDVLLELSKVTDTEESMKGQADVAYGQEPVTSAYRPGVPDITQRIAECGPTSAANSIISLAGEHGQPLNLSDTEIIDGLKATMDWTPENGVLPDAFVQGKNEWAVKNGLPIRTRKIGDKNGLSTLEQMLDGMDKGGAAELRLTFGDPNTGKAVGGHAVTVVGIRTEGGQTFIDINDPKTPEGTETYEVNANVVDGYPYSGVTVLSWGFIQEWDENAPANLDAMTDLEIQGIKDAVGIKEKVKVIVFRNKHVPIAQVHVSKGPECDEAPHYHANTGSVTSLDGTVFTDPGNCGYGKVTEVPVLEVQIN